MVFVARCASAAAIAHIVAQCMGLSFPVWASVSALIVSQERLAETKSSLRGRVVGTVLGAVVAVIINALGARINLHIDLQIILAVAICAYIARRYGALRVSMWTSPLVLLTTQANVSVLLTGTYRSTEVILGGLIGAALHLMADKALPIFTPYRVDDVPGHVSKPDDGD